jgi:hypothetical protein
MFGTVGEIIGIVSGIGGIAGMTTAVYRIWRRRRILEWFHLTPPPPVPKRVPSRLKHPRPVNHGAANKVFLVGTNALSGTRVRYLVKSFRSGGESCYVYDLQAGTRVRDIDGAGGAIAWNNFFERIGHPIPYTPIAYDRGEDWVNYGLQQAALMHAEVER